MTFDLQPDTKRPLEQCGATVAAGRDARWRGIDVLLSEIDSETVNCLDVMDEQQEQQDFGFNK